MANQDQWQREVDLRATHRRTNVQPRLKTRVAVKAGVFAAVGTRFGEVIDDPDEDNEVELRWLDDGSKSDYIIASKLTSVTTGSN
eukprot:COSAG02_NODE_66743_length_254_cov_1.329032_1_plen_84_part_11